MHGRKGNTSRQSHKEKMKVREISEGENRQTKNLVSANNFLQTESTKRLTSNVAKDAFTNAAINANRKVNTSKNSKFTETEKRTKIDKARHENFGPNTRTLRSTSERESPKNTKTISDYHSSPFSKWAESIRLDNNVANWRKNSRKLTVPSRKLHTVRGEGREPSNLVKRSITSHRTSSKTLTVRTGKFGVIPLHRQKGLLTRPPSSLLQLFHRPKACVTGKDLSFLPFLPQAFVQSDLSMFDRRKLILKLRRINTVVKHREKRDIIENRSDSSGINIETGFNSSVHNNHNNISYNIRNIINISNISNISNSSEIGNINYNNSSSSKISYINSNTSNISNISNIIYNSSNRNNIGYNNSKSSNISYISKIRYNSSNISNLSYKNNNNNKKKSNNYINNSKNDIRIETKIESRTEETVNDGTKKNIGKTNDNDTAHSIRNVTSSSNIKNGTIIDVHSIINNNNNNNSLLFPPSPNTTTASPAPSSHNTNIHLSINGCKYDNNSPPHCTHHNKKDDSSRHLSEFSSTNEAMLPVLNTLPEHEQVRVLASQQTMAESGAKTPAKTPAITPPSLEAAWQKFTRSASVRLRIDSTAKTYDATADGSSSAKQVPLHRKERSVPENSTVFDDANSTDVSEKMPSEDLSHHRRFVRSPLPVYYVFLMPFDQFRMFSLVKVFGALGVAFDKVRVGGVVFEKVRGR
ncbi:hypothetical protein EGW08_018330 [Elysia chlorotica]|uniref:Uncharacterized protein n=1 Tax=Elysia chlorotica TaxID=188477 RepID=A0A3S0ZS20_ELYCH|nr:hypothetical protein EGW08_018330 [Elysia chlorotica]